MGWFLVVGVLLGGCLETNFEPRSKIQDWRALTVVVSSPTFRPGDDVTFTPFAVDPEGRTLTATGTLTPTAGGGLRCDGGVCFVWTLCLRPDRTPGLSGLQFSPEVPSQACGAAMGFTGVPAASATVVDPFVIQEDGSASLDSAFVRTFLEGDTLAMTATQLGIPLSLLEQIQRDVGVTFVAELRVIEDVGGEQMQRIVSFKRALIRDDGCVSTADSPCPGFNPPRPEFSIRLSRAEQDDAVWASSRGLADPFRCQFCERQSDGTCQPMTRAVQLIPNETYVLDPEEVPLDPDAPGTWIERYTVLDIAGGFIEANEGAFYSWFSTDGTLDREVTNAPADEELWKTPAEPGSYPLWVIVRDGQGGTSGCRLDVRVGRISM